MKKRTLRPFEQTLVDCVLEEFKDVPAEDQIDMTFTPSFEAKAQELIRKSERNHWSSGKVFLRKVAIVALISAMLLLTACSIPAVREAIIEFFFKDVGTHYEFTYDPEQALLAPNAIERVYSPTYTPNGYEKMGEDVSAAGVIVVWTNADGMWLNYMQGIIPDDPLSGEGGNFNSEGASAEWITVNGCSILRVEDAEYLTYAWTSSEYTFSISCPLALGDEEVEKIFDSIRIDDDAVIFGAE